MRSVSPPLETSATTSPTLRAPRRRWALALLAVPVLLGGLALNATANEDGGPGMHVRGRGGHHPGQRLHHMLELAGATDAQKAQIKATWDNLRPQLRAVAQDHMKLRQSLQQALAAPTIDPAAIERLRRDSVQLMDKKSALFTQGMVATAQALTAEQRQKILDEVRKHQGDHHMGGMGGMGEAP